MKKLITFGLSAATALSMTGGVLMPIAGAVTIAELQAQIAELTAQLAAMGGSEAECYAFTVDLSEGSTGADVTALQDYLTGTGHFTFGSSTGYFGSITKAAVAAWQTANGVSPAAGYFGALSRAKYNAICTPAEEGEEAGDLEGGAGSVEDWELDSSLSNEEVGEGEEDVLTYGLEGTAEGSDLQFTAVTIDLDQNSAANDDFGDYAAEVSVWLDGEEYARVDGDEFDEDQDWRKTITLDSGAIVEEDADFDLQVAFSGADNIDSDDVTDTWDVEIDSVRYKDGTGATVTEDPGLAVRTFSFETFATAADAELTVSTGDAAINDARVVEVDDANETEEESLFAFDVEIEGGSDMVVDEIEVGAVVDSTGDDLDEIATQFYMFMDGEEVGQENVPADGDVVILFDDLDLTLEAGETYEFIVKADLLGTDGALNPGDTIEFDLTDAANINDWDVEDEEGEDVDDADKGGSANGGELAFFDSGISVTFVDASATKSTEADPSATSADIAEFVIEFDVEAFGADAYVGSTAIEDTTPDGSDGAEYDITGSATVTLTDDLDSTADLGASDGWLVEEGETESFTLTVWAEVTVAGSARLELGGVGWNLDDASPDTAYTYNMDEYRTGALNLILYP